MQRSDVLAQKKKRIFLLVLILATLSFTQVVCKKQPSEAECNELEYNVSVAVSEFPQSCTVDTDCVSERVTVSRNGEMCLPFYCGVIVTQATFAEFQNFLATDPNVTARCDAVLDSGCTVTLKNVPNCPAAKPVCDGGTCGASF